MDDRIRELAEQAGIVPGVMGLNRFTYFNPEKFAKLIVRECIVYLDGEITRLCEYQKSLPDWDENKRDDVNFAIEKCMDNIAGLKEHFGIDE